MAISKVGFMKEFERLDELQIHIDTCQQTIDSAVNRQNNFKMVYERIVRQNLIPSITISEIAKSDNLDAHLRASASYELGNKRVRFNIYIGKLSEFPLGKTDPKAIRLVREKAFEYLRKKHPSNFKDM